MKTQLERPNKTFVYLVMVKLGLIALPQLLFEQDLFEAKLHAKIDIGCLRGYVKGWVRFWMRGWVSGKVRGWRKG